MLLQVWLMCLKFLSIFYLYATTFQKLHLFSSSENMGVKVSVLAMVETWYIRRATKTGSFGFLQLFHLKTKTGHFITFRSFKKRRGGGWGEGWYKMSKTIVKFLISPLRELLFIVQVTCTYKVIRTFTDLHTLFIFTDASCLLNIIMPHTTSQKSTWPYHGTQNQTAGQVVQD